MTFGLPADRSKKLKVKSRNQHLLGINVGFEKLLPGAVDRGMHPFSGSPVLLVNQFIATTTIQRELMQMNTLPSGVSVE